MRSEKAKDETILIRVARDEKRRLAAAARQCEMTLSQFLRQTATEAAARLAA